MSRALPPIAASWQRWIRDASGVIQGLGQAQDDAAARLRALEGPQPSLNFTPGAAPASPAEGEAYYDAASHRLRVWDGSAWQNCW